MGVMRMALSALGTAAVMAAGLAPAAPPAEPQRPHTAASAQTWSVQPANEAGADGRASWGLEVEAGESVDDFAQVNNFGEQPLTFRVYSQDATNTPAGAFTLQPADAEPAKVGAWVGLSEQVTVGPGDHAIVPFTITVPADTPPGDYAGGIVASVTTSATNAEGEQVLVDNRVGSRVYLRVDGALAAKLEVVGSEATYDRSWIPFSSGGVTVTFEVRNAGNVRLSGEQAVTGHGPLGLGKHATTLDEFSEILPGESVTMTAQIDDVAPLVLVTEQVAVTPRPARADAGAPAADEASATASVWAMPWPELILLLGLTLGGWVSWWLLRRRKRRTAAMVDEAVAEAREQLRLELQQENG